MTSKPTSLFEDAMDAVRQFQRKYDEAQKFRNNLPDSEKEIAKFEELLGRFAFRHDGTAPIWDGPFKRWLTECFNLSEMPSMQSIPGRKVMEVLEGKAEPSQFFELLDAYAAEIQGALDRSAPARFSYQGFKIENPERMGEVQCRMLLEGVDYVVALFKKRGVTPILRETITTVRLMPALGEGQGNFTTFGYYIPAAREIEMSAKAAGAGKGRFMKWVNEVFLHEVGHHVHLHFLPPDAKAAWDQGWAEVNEKKKIKDDLFGKITHAERLEFYDLLKDNDWDIGRVAKKLKGAAKVKYGAWLRSPLMGNPLITAKQWKLTKEGKPVFDFLSNPARYMKENFRLETTDPDFQERLTRKAEQIADRLGLTWAGDYGVPSETVAEMSESDPAIAKAVDEAMAKLEIVSDYGMTNEKEDFAESFVAFMGAPEKLTSTAKFRMQRALSLSGLYGKQVMRLALKVAARFALRENIFSHRSGTQEVGVAPRARRALERFIKQNPSLFLHP
jgi:hypothetical protein